MPLIHNDPLHLRDQASEARAAADKMTNPEGKKAVNEIAEKYERLTARAWHRA
jgi:hypothetical protein